MSAESLCELLQLLWQKQLRKGRVCFGSQFQGTLLSIMTRMAWQQVRETAGHLVPAVRLPLTFSILFSPGPPSS